MFLSERVIKATDVIENRTFSLPVKLEDQETGKMSALFKFNLSNLCHSEASLRGLRVLLWFRWTALKQKTCRLSSGGLS